MSFTGVAPEALLPRSDSRNPATTCKGITKSGRACRRAIDAKASADDGVLAVVSVVSDGDEEETGAAAYFCWQHKDQAERLTSGNAEGQDTHLYPLKERSSIDTLVARLGVLDVEDPAEAQKQAQRQRRRQSRQDGTSRPPRRINRPPTWDHVQGPLMSVPSDLMAQQKHSNHRPAARPQKKKPSFWRSLCCGEADDDYVEVVRHKKRIQNQQPETVMNSNLEDFLRPQTSQPTPQFRPNGAVPVSKPTSTSPGRHQNSSIPNRKPLGEKTARPLNKTASRPSETSTLLSYIPKSLPPQLASTLLAEMSKPISQSDEEGYIYIFWLTPDDLGPAPSSTASTLLSPPSRPDQNRRTSDILRQYSVRQSPQQPRGAADTTRQRRLSGNPSPSSSSNEKSDQPEKKTIFLKIGRANNVTRRMNEWKRQCGYSLSLVRYYPYVPSTPSPSPNASPAHSRHQSYNNSDGQRPSDTNRRVSSGVRKVPHAHRVERLIHLELGEKRVMKQCEACGKEHREWFEVEASREGIKGVDEVVRRWVEWAERRVDD
ncbi:DUF1766-domain-containing protein [Periconia macrospinosa]|uniref:DUF1766-domain-containing protein n=1 Tax=Periconia macrospinosa TaxID=97972 RepID=A0A2V1DYX0_9PLEO|nr:DUF1766-domain-containing protein [Periconia macrospinosa]